MNPNVKTVWQIKRTAKENPDGTRSREFGRGWNLNDDKSQFISLNSCCKMELHKINDFDRLVELSGDEAISFFSIDDENADTEPFGTESEKGNYRTNKLYMVCSLHLNKSKNLLETYETAEEMLYACNLKIKQAVKEVIEGVDIKVFAGVSDCDIVVIASGMNITGLMDVWPVIRAVPIKDNGNECLFRSSNSFLAVFNNTLEFDKEESRAVLSFSLNGLEGCDKLKTLFENKFDPSNLKFSYVTGDFDFSIYIHKCNLTTLFCVLGIWDADRRLYETAKEFTELYDSCVRKMSVRLFKSSVLKISSAPSFGAVCQNELNKDTKNLNELINNIGAKIPDPAKRTLKLLVDECKDLLRDSSHYIAARRMYQILNRLMSTIDKSSSPFSGHAITSCIGDLGATVNTTVPSGSHLNPAVNPADKCFNAYEKIVRDIFDKLDGNINADGADNRRDNKPLFYITLNPMERISSKGYLERFNFYPEDGVDYSDDESITANVFSINLPDASFFDPAKSMPYVAHELAHYVITGHERCEARNKAYLEMSRLYLKYTVWEYLGRTKGLEANYLKIMDALIDYPLVDFDYKLPAWKFTEQVKRYMQEIHSFAERVVTEKYAISEEADKNKVEKFRKDLYNYDLDSRTDTLFKGILDGLRAVCRSHTPFDALSLSVIEARADMLMACICGLTPYEYLNALYDYYTNNKLPSMQVDLPFTIRTAAVLTVLVSNDKNRLPMVKFFESVVKKLKEKEINVDKYSFFMTAINYEESNRKLLRPLVEYLDKLYDYASDKLSGINTDSLLLYKRYRVKTSEQEESCDKVFSDIVRLLYAQWYEGLHYWKEN